MSGHGGHLIVVYDDQFRTLHSLLAIIDRDGGMPKTGSKVVIIFNPQLSQNRTASGETSNSSREKSHCRAAVGGE
ncbi:hypothetical protein DAPPUDRAFT_245387 [Daphnia pulex]|uniref:Uncharacterized protein n=1 Tax=Daphnia pulex TaxID=6669 RepID=E9GN90_DAPPU|nr:hypothetical protein DAPPUDRAFT_245387 [Daphnia pulex]|eukprot:EFX78993.1 hypothetical protein DAPPUDRAFT_245387 [Daphnia pulex]